MSAPVSLPLLKNVGVASPCTVSWDQMTGDDKVRHCALCNLNVHNLSAMTAQEAEALLQNKGDNRLCIRFYQRADGTIITQDCPVGLAAVRVRARRAFVRVAAMIGVTASTVVAARSVTSPDTSVRLRSLNPFAKVAAWFAPQAPAAPSTVIVTMGDYAFPTPPPVPTPPTSGATP